MQQHARGQHGGVTVGMVCRVREHLCPRYNWQVCTQGGSVSDNKLQDAAVPAAAAVLIIGLWQSHSLTFGMLAIIA